jgi:CheY-like chemotaxis protein
VRTVKNVCLGALQYTQPMNRSARPAHGRGRRIVVRPPAAPRDATQRQGIGSPERVAPKRKTILIVEDNASFGGLLVALLREEGYRSLRAWDGQEAANMARDRRPDLIILDLALPYREGISILRQLKSQTETAKAPVLVFSGNILVLTPEEEQLVEGVVTKPFDIDRVLNVIRKALGEPEQEVPDKPGYDYGHEHAY